jgi:hypothetical protein
MARHIKFKPSFSKADNAWVLNIPTKFSETGKRLRRYFPNEAQANQEAAKIRNRLMKFGESGFGQFRQAEMEEVYRIIDFQRERTGEFFSVVHIVQEYFRSKEYAENNKA